MKDLSNENVIHIKKNGIEYLQFKRLLKYPELVHCYTLSSNAFDIGSNDTYKQKSELVKENYKKLASSLNINIDNILRPYQTHTNVVKCIQNEYKQFTIFPKELTDVDGLLTNKTNIMFSLSYADCTPIYLYDSVKKVVGNIHSGWQGTLQGIGKIAVQTMIYEYNSNPKDIICLFGPHIKKCHFEVEEDVANKFKKQYSNMENINDIIQYTGKINEENKYHIDTTKINENLVKELGLKQENIIDSGICTVCNKDQMHSYRAHGVEAGRNTALIGIKK